jgi:hypothetical protein
MIDLESLGSVLNQMEVLGLKVNFKQSLRTKSGLSSKTYYILKWK